MSVIQLVKQFVFGTGDKPRTIRGGQLLGLRFNLDLAQSTQPWRGTYERCLQDWLASHVTSGATCLDIGASDGYFTLLMAKLACPAGTVLAFEPGEEAPQIRQNLDLNPTVPLATVEVFNAFVSAEPGERAVSVDTLVAERGLSRVDVVKIDVDGGEADVLRGMATTLEQFQPHLFLEVHSRELLAEVESVTKALGYEMKLERPAVHEHRPIEFNVFYYSTARPNGSAKWPA